MIIKIQALIEFTVEQNDIEVIESNIIRLPSINDTPNIKLIKITNIAPVENAN